MEVQVGQTVRVTALKGESTQRGMISFINTDAKGDSDDTYDVIYSESGTEENIVAACRVASLQDFETNKKMDMDAECLKGHGNTLFKLKDFTAAVEWYLKAIVKLEMLSLAPQSIQDPVFSVGQNVLVEKINSFKYKRGMVSDNDINNKCVDVIYDVHLHPCEEYDGVEENDEEGEEGIPLNRVIGMQNSDELLLLQRSICLNLGSYALCLIVYNITNLTPQF
jgi:hypothetical protein